MEKIVKKYCTTHDYIVLATHLSKIITSAEITINFITLVNDLIIKDVELLKVCLADDGGNEYTEILAFKDDERDEAFLAFKKLINALTVKSRFKEDAIVIQTIMKKYHASLHDLSYEDQSEQMEKLISELNEEKNMRRIRSIAADLWYNDMVTTQNDFEEMYRKKLSTENKKSYPSFRDARAKLVHHLKVLINCFSIYEELEYNDYRKVINKINKLISEVITKARVRKNGQV